MSLKWDTKALCGQIGERMIVSQTKKGMIERTKAGTRGQASNGIQEHYADRSVSG